MKKKFLCIWMNQTIQKQQKNINFLVEKEGHLDPPSFSGNFPLKDIFYYLCLPSVSPAVSSLQAQVSHLQEEDQDSPALPPDFPLKRIEIDII